MAKVKATENVAQAVETNQNVQLKDMSSEDLALALNNQWIQMTQAQLNIQNINAELQRRTNEPKPE